MYKAEDVGFNIDMALSTPARSPPPQRVALGTHQKVWRKAGASAAACGYGFANAGPSTVSQPEAARLEQRGPMADGWSRVARAACAPSAAVAVAAAASMLGAGLRAIAEAVSPVKTPALPKCTCTADEKGKLARALRKSAGGSGRGGRVRHHISCPKGVAERARSAQKMQAKRQSQQGGARGDKREQI
jgi:hypothetical protein